MSRLDTMLTKNPVPTWRGMAWLVGLLLAAALVWANFARLDEVAIAPAEVVPRGQVKVIQHLEGGIIRRIEVDEGQRVEAGDALVVLGCDVMHAARPHLGKRIIVINLYRRSCRFEPASDIVVVIFGEPKDNAVIERESEARL